MPNCRLVPVRKPCWMPAFEDLYDVTRKLVPVIFVAVWMRRVVHELPVDEEGRVQVRDRRALQLTFKPLSTPPCPLPALAAAGAARAQTACWPARRARPTTAARNAVRDIAEQGARVGAHQVGFRQLRIVARVFQIEIVLQRQRDGVAQGKINVAGAHQLVEPGRIFEAEHRNRVGRVVVGEPAEEPVAAAARRFPAFERSREGPWQGKARLRVWI